MPIRQRLIFLFISLLVLIVIGLALTGSLEFITQDFWFAAGILMLILLSIVDQPHFSKDANIFVNGVAGLISLFSVSPESRTKLWITFLIWSLYLVICSYVLMFIRSKMLTKENRILTTISRINRQIGRPEALFSAFFLWGVYTQFGDNAYEFQILWWYWAVFMILNIPSISKALSDLLAKDKMEQGNAVGILKSFLSPRVLEVQLKTEILDKFVGKRVEVHAGNGSIGAYGIVIDDRVMNQARFAKLGITETTKDWSKLSEESGSNETYISVCESEIDENSPLPVSVIDSGTDINNLKFYINPELALQEGEVISVNLESGERAFFQIVAAKITEEEYAAPQKMQNTLVTAGQLGIWQTDRCRFEPIPWVATAGGLVYRISRQENEKDVLPSDHVKVGTVPNSTFPVHINLQDIITHNTAIVFGVTGSGKSYLAFHIIEEIVRNEIRVLILDISRQHYVFLRDLNPFAIKELNDVGKWMESDQLIGIHQFATATSYPTRTAEIVAAAFDNLADYKKLRPGRNEPAKLCVVFEEAHSLIPEWQQVAQKEDTNQVNRTARTILQGRKYGIGCIVITQRTANVTKTILNQCNTIFALQSFDQTGLDFLRNYMGDAYAQAISTLPIRHAILVGKASSSTRPIILKVSDFSNRWKDKTKSDDKPNDSDIDL